MAAIEASHAQIWDDSALVDSWNEAFEEYKKYHSLAARGEDIEALLDKAETGEELEVAEINHVESVKNHGINDSKSDTPALVPSRIGKAKASAAPLRQPGITASSISQQQQSKSAATPPVRATDLPQALLNNVQDEGMKNLMMSWYYAGYYTGLYEGQQKAYAEMREG